MTEELEEYEEKIKTKLRFGFTPKYKEEFRTHLEQETFIAITFKVIEKLEWDLVYYDEQTVEVKRRNDFDRWTEKIIITYDHRNVTVKSISLNANLFDGGANSKRARLFIHVFQQTLEGYDKDALTQLQKETDRKNNWDDYEIPDSLPQPNLKKPNFNILLAGGIITALILGYIIAFISVEAMYFVVFFEFGVAVALTSVLIRLIKISNYTNPNKLNILLIALTILTYASCQYFEYMIITNKQSWISIGFFEYMKQKTEPQLIINWICQSGLTYIIALLRFTNKLTIYQIERIPIEVNDFAFYHFLKGKSEEEVRNELSRMGWKEKYQQDEVFDAISAIDSINKTNRQE